MSSRASHLMVRTGVGTMLGLAVAWLARWSSPNGAVAPRRHRVRRR